MASSDPKGKSLMNEEEEILCPMPLAIYNPYEIEHEQDENEQDGSESENIDGKNVDHQEQEPQNNQALLHSVVEKTEIGHYEISAKDEKEIQERDEVFERSPEFEKYKNSWIPVSERLKGWTIQTRRRTNGGRREQFYYHHSFQRQLRSKKQVYNFLRYGLVPTRGDGKSSSEAAENLLPEPKRQRSQTPKEAVEAFLAEARNNLNNHKG